jgi:hypothetical protein
MSTQRAYVMPNSNPRPVATNAWIRLWSGGMPVELAAVFQKVLGPPNARQVEGSRK